ncbi:hypothetical protein OQA88_3680 [Cercophora sp. LCS_1]
MRFTTIVSASLLAISASAQSSAAAATTTAAAAAPQNSQQAAIVACLEACKEGDVDCQSKCIAVPNPNEDDANATNNCVAECPQGKGTVEDNVAYANCVDGCIAKYYYTTTGAGIGVQPTAGAGGRGTNPPGSGATGVSPSGSAVPTGTEGEKASGTAASGSSQTSNPAQGLSVAGSTMGFVGFLAALLAF